MTYAPNESQQMAMSYAPKPFAALSAVSSSLIIYHIVRRNPQKLKRMYHRLVLAMTFCVFFESIVLFFGAWVIPVGTPYTAGASGTVQTCTLHGFLHVVFAIAIPYYYASLSVFSYVAVKNNFKEEKYRCLEKFIHPCAIGIPTLFLIWPTITGSINPFGANCWIAGSPRGCEEDEEIQCERGNEDLLNYYAPILGYCQVFLYFIAPPTSMICLYRWIRKAEKEFTSSTGMKRVIESHRKQVLRSILVQMGLYLFSLWFTYIFSTIGVVYNTFTGKFLYNILIIGACVMASQGMIIAAVYYFLDKIAKSARVDEETFVSRISSNSNKASQPHSQHRITICSIRKNIEEEEARRKNQIHLRKDDSKSQISNSRKLNFSIFDGTPSEGSPWAQFIDEDFDEEEDSNSETDDIEEKESSRSAKVYL